MVLRWTWCGALLLAACGSTAGFVPPSDTGPGVVTPVEVIEPGFVRFEGRRRAIEWFLYEMRCRARAAGRDADKLPRVVIRLDPDVQLRQGMLDRLREELSKAGIQQIEFGSAE